MYRQDQSVGVLHPKELNSIPEVTRITCLADTGAYEKITATFPTTANATNADYVHLVNKTGTKYAVWLDKTSEAEAFTATLPATAGASQGDYFAFQNPAGVKTAVWLDIDNNGTAPTGAVYAAADNKIKASIATDDTLVQVAAKIVTAIGSTEIGFSFVDNEDGTITFTSLTRGAISTNAAPHNTGDTGNGSIAVAIDNEGVAAVAPIGALYVAADHQIKVEISTGGTAADNAALVKTAIEAEEHWDEFTITNKGSGVLEFNSTKLGDLTNSVSKKEDDSEAGSITLAITAGVASNLQNKYFIMRNPAATVFNAWFNVSSEGVDPNPAGTEIACAITNGSTAAQVAAAIATAVNANSNFKAWVQDDYLYIANEAVGAATDVSAGNSGFTILKIQDGKTGTLYPSMSPSSFSNEPSLIS